MKEYRDFLASKRVLAPARGFDIPEDVISPLLFPFQRDIVRWAVKRGKAAVFAHTGLGKGPIQLEWSRIMARHTERPSLIAAPLAVAQQFMGEAEKFRINITACKTQDDVRPGVNVTNYERLDAFDLESFGAVAMDESSCIKDWTSKLAQTLIERLKNTPYKLCSTATPSPNDHAELGTHAELLDVMRRAAMLAMFFEHDGGQTSKWALKGHGKKPFWKFIASWAICIKKPSDLGYSDDGFELPPLHMHEHIVPVDQSVATEGMLFRCPDLSATGLHKELRLTASARAIKLAEIVQRDRGVPWLLWCNTDYEAKAIHAALPGVVEVCGPEKPEPKEAKLMGFARGEILEMLSKPEIAGWGMNYQHCWNMAFVGLSYSFESMFQAIRRCWRFGQTKPVNVHVIYAETEGPVLETIRRKEAQYNQLQTEMNIAMREEQLAQRSTQKSKYEHSRRIKVPEWLK